MERQEYVKELFQEALQLGSVQEREKFLASRCGNDNELRQQLEALLWAHAHAGNFMQPGPLTPYTGGERAGTVIGRYRLLEQIGQGGFGVVWMAEQLQPVRRRVALKIIKVGMDTREVVARFEAERQALAMMEHPNIARVFDGGASETGRPYFVMELVRGVTITSYCDAHHLPPRARLELFIRVCQAVQHAHQKGIIHRDLKPSNILICVQDDRPVPKVIDFGVAKATAAPLTDKTLFTRFHQLVGTPAYMSPEQAGLGNGDIDTRSDIYSLGVLLYELLTGRTPFDTQKLLEEGYEAMLRVIREAEPSKPSTRLSTLSVEELQQVATVRKTEPNRLGRLVRGDLDWIVMKALEKERARRYGTAGDFAKDLQRYLDDQPVEASPPSTVYRARRFLRRNRLLAASAGSIALVLLLAVPISLSLAWVATRERQRAIQAQWQANTNAFEAHQRLVRIDVANGVRAMETHDFFAARLWFTEALRQEIPGTRAERMHRYRIGALESTSPRLVQVWNHGAPVHIAGLSPDGRWALTAGSDNTVRLWNVLSGQPGATLVHSTNITRAVFSGDSQRVLTVAWDNAVRIWDVASGALACPALRHDSRVQCALISRDGRRAFTLTNGDDPRPGSLASRPAGLAAGEVRLWDAETGQQLRAPLRRDNAIRDLVLSPDDQWLGATMGSSAIVWNLRHGNALVLTTNACQPLAPASPLPASDAGATEAVLPDFPGAKTTREQVPVEPEVIRLAFSPDSRQVLTVFANSSGSIWSLAGGPRLPLRPSKKSIRNAMRSSPRLACFTPDGGRVLIADYELVIWAWDAHTGEWEGPLQKKGDENFCVSADGLFGWFGGQVCDLDTGELIAPAPLHWGCQAAVFSPDALRVLTAGQDGLARIWDLAGVLPLPAAFRHDWATVARNRSSGPETSSEPSLAQRLLESAPLFGGDVRDACFSSDSTKVLTLSENGSARVWNANTGAPLISYLTLNKPLASGAFSRDGARFAIGGGYLNDGVARIYETATGLPVSPTLTYTSQVDSVELSPDGKWLITRRYIAGADLAAADTGKSVLPAQEPGMLFYDATFSPNGSLVAICTGTPIGPGPEQDRPFPLVRRYYRWRTQLCETGTWKPIATLNETNRIARMQFSPNGRWLLAMVGKEFLDEFYMSKANHVLSIRIWDAQTGQPVSPSLKLTEIPIQPQALFSDDNRHLCLFDFSGNAIVWDVAAQQPLDAEQWRGFKHGGRVLSPDGQRLAGGFGEPLALYDALTGDPLTPPLLQRTASGRFYPVRLSPDGQKLVVSNGDRAQLWNLPPDDRPMEDLVALAELLAGRRIGALGDFNSPPGAAVRSSWERLRSKYPATFAASPVQARLRRENLVELCEETGRPFGAIFHLEILANENPNDENLRLSLVRARTAAALSRVQ